MIRKALTALAAGAALCGGIAIAQTDKMAPTGQGEATIYRDLNFQGPAVFMDRAQPNLGLNWPVRSIRVKSGYWQLCSRKNYGGRCVTITADEADIRGQTGFFDRVQSARPLGGPSPEPVEPAPPAQGATQGLVGSAFYPAPGENGYRVLACTGGSATANCGRDTANRFCRNNGWTRAAYSSMQTVNRRVYLADVLCVRSAV